MCVCKYHHRDDLSSVEGDRNDGGATRARGSTFRSRLRPSAVLPFAARPTPRLEFPGKRAKVDDSLCIIFTCSGESVGRTRATTSSYEKKKARTRAREEGARRCDGVIT